MRSRRHWPITRASLHSPLRFAAAARELLPLESNQVREIGVTPSRRG